MKQKNNYTSVPLKVLIFIAWRNIVSKKLRALLTIFGIVIGIGAIFFLLSFGIGLQKLVTTQVVGNKSIKSVDITTPNAKVVKLDEAVFNKIKNLPHVKRIGRQYSQAGKIKSHGSEIDTIVYGVDSGYLEIDSVQLIAGKLLRSQDGNVAIINEAVVRSEDISSANEAIGKTIKLHIPAADKTDGEKAVSFKVVGVTKGAAGNEIYIPSGVFAGVGLKDYAQLKLEVDETSNIKDLRGQIETLGLQTSSPVDTVDQINQVFKFFNVILAGFGAIGMIVAILGMFNTLTISLLERTKEIGLMLALGGRNRDMKRLFVFEAMLLSLVGAAVGIIGAVITGQIVNLVMNLLARHRGVQGGFQLFAVPWWLVLGMMVFMSIVGIIVVFIPARRAAKISPIDALRRE